MSIPNSIKNNVDISTTPTCPPLNYLNKSTLDQGTLYVYEQEFTDILEEKLKKIDGIDEVYGWFENSFPIVLDSNIITEEFKSIYGSRYSYVESEEYIDRKSVV